MDPVEIGSSSNGACPAVCGACVEALSVGTEQDWSAGAFADGEVDGSGGAWHERDHCGLLPSPMIARVRWPRSLPT
jgi:hypothetical protein